MPTHSPHPSVTHTFAHIINQTGLTQWAGRLFIHFRRLLPRNVWTSAYGSRVGWTPARRIHTHTYIHIRVPDKLPNQVPGETNNPDTAALTMGWNIHQPHYGGLAAAQQVEKDYAMTTRVLYTPTDVHIHQQGLTYLDLTQVQTFVPVSKVLLHPTQHRHSVIDDSHRNNLTRFIAKTGWLCIRHPKDLQMILQKITVQHNRSKT